MLRVFLVAFAFASGACVADDAPLEVGADTQAIVGGKSAVGFPGVVLIGGCTGTVIAPRVVLTAAHCRIGVGDRTFVVNIDEPLSEHRVIAVHNHRLFNDTGMVAPADVALAHLDSDPMVAAHPFPVDRLEDLFGAEVVSVGFGANNVDGFSGFGTKRTARFTIDLVSNELIEGEGTEGEAICFGDSGGPAFLEVGADLHVIGVASRTQGCRSDSGWTRVESYARDFIIPALDSFEGPCAFDGRCETSGCRTPDPDCAPCGLDGVCSTGCEVVDLDCPPKSPFASACTVNDDCESLLCVDAESGEGRLCSQPCSATETCPTQGECVARPEGDVCLPRQAEFDRGGCGCSSTGSGSSLALLLLFGLGLVSRRAYRYR